VPRPSRLGRHTHPCCYQRSGHRRLQVPRPFQCRRHCQGSHPGSHPSLPRCLRRPPSLARDLSVPSPELSSRHRFLLPGPLGFKELGSALPLIASLHKELPYSPQEERHVMVSSGDQPLIVSMDNWFIWDPGGRATIVRDDSPARRSVLQHSWTLGISISQDVKGLFLSRYLA
jgi:hypothetical protein